MKKIEDEIELKRELDNFHIRYGDLKNEFIFVVEFYDNKSDTIISRGLYTSPIAAVRDLNKIIPSIKLPIQDITTILTFVLPTSANNPAIYVGLELSPFLYFPKAEIEAELKVKEE